MDKRYPIFWWYGGKHYLLPELLRRTPPHRCYAEVFGGAASLLMYKDPVDVELYNDVNGDLVHFFRVLRDEEQGALLVQRLQDTLYAEEEWRMALQPCEDAVERARRFYVRCAQSFNGAGSAWSLPSARFPRNRARHFARMVDGLDWFRQRMRHVMVVQRDFRELIPRLDAPNWFLYLDPPYHPETRVAQRVYQHEMTRDDHQALVQCLLAVRHAKVMVSGYDHADYDELVLRGWRKETISIAKRAGGSSNRAEEVIWMNYDVGYNQGDDGLEDSVSGFGGLFACAEEGSWAVEPSL